MQPGLDVSQTDRAYFTRELVKFLRKHLPTTNDDGARLEQASIKFEDSIFRTSKTKNEYVNRILKKMYEISKKSPVQAADLETQYWKLFDCLKVFLIPLKRRIQVEKDKSNKQVQLQIFTLLSRKKCDVKKPVTEDDFKSLRKIEIYLNLLNLKKSEDMSNNIKKCYEEVGKFVKSGPNATEWLAEELKRMILLLQGIKYSESGHLPSLYSKTMDGDAKNTALGSPRVQTQWKPSHRRKFVEIEDDEDELEGETSDEDSNLGKRKFGDDSLPELAKMRKVDTMDAMPMDTQASVPQHPQTADTKMSTNNTPVDLPQRVHTELSAIVSKKQIAFSVAKKEEGSITFEARVNLGRDVEERIGIVPRLYVSIKVPGYPNVEPTVLFPAEYESNLFLKRVKERFSMSFVNTTQRNILSIVEVWQMCIRSSLSGDVRSEGVDGAFIYQMPNNNYFGSDGSAIKTANGPTNGIVNGSNGSNAANGGNVGRGSVKPVMNYGADGINPYSSVNSNGIGSYGAASMKNVNGTNQYPGMMPQQGQPSYGQRFFMNGFTK